jgi:magnesium-transporting ATPase (P-type)
MDSLSFRSKNRTKKQPSLPKNWPNPSDEDLAANPLRVINIAKAQNYSFKNNFVKTSKYEVWNFLPLFLFEEFNPKVKVANCYFLMISCLQTIPAISNTNGIPTFLLPLTFVVLVDALFQIIEDYHRHKADGIANSSIAKKFDLENDQLVDTPWAELHVGDFVKIFSREPVPADILVLGVHEKVQPPQGLCYIETKSLDGETNLKLRQALPATTHLVRISRYIELLFALRGVVCISVS